MSKEFSMEESENIIANFQNGDSAIANYLTELSDVSKIKLPPVPSFDNQTSNIRSFFSARKGATVVAIEVAILATAVASAAALSGIGPKPVVNFVQSAATQVKDVVKSVSTFITEDDDSAPNPDMQLPDPQPTAAPVATETPNSQPAPSSQPTTATPQAPQSTPKATPKATPTPVSPSVKPDPKPTAPGMGVPAPTKKSDDDDDDHDDDEGDDDHKSLTPKATSTRPGTKLSSPKPKESPTKKSSDDDDDDHDDEEDDD